MLPHLNYVEIGWPAANREIDEILNVSNSIIPYIPLDNDESQTNGLQIKRFSISVPLIHFYYHKYIHLTITVR